MVCATDSASDLRPAFSNSISSTPSSNNLLLRVARRSFFFSRSSKSCLAWLKKVELPTKTEREWRETALNCSSASASRISWESLKYSALSLSLAPEVEASSSRKGCNKSKINVHCKTEMKAKICPVNSLHYKIKKCAFCVCIVKKT